MSTITTSRAKAQKSVKPKKVAAKVAETSGRKAVALAVRKALLRKPRLNLALVELFRSSRDRA